MKISERSIWFDAGCAALIISAIVYAPVFTGKIPFPSDFVFDFPPFAPAMPSYVSTMQTNIGDLVTSFYPYRTIAARAAREWTVPLWNPDILSGAPFLAMAQSALFYPPNFLYYVLPVPLAWTIGFVLRRLLAVIFTALFLQRLGATRAGAIAAGLIFGFCGFLTAWQGQAISDAAIWLPLICYAVVRLRDEPDTRSIAVASLAFAMPVLAGHPETAAHLTLTGTALAAFLFVRSRRFAFAKAFAVSGVLAVALAAVQILPTVEWLKYIHHSLKDPWPAPPLWSIVGMVSRDVVRAKTTALLLMPEHAAYLAMMTFIAAPIGLLRRNTRALALFFAIWTAAAFSVAYGTGPGHWIVQSLPVLSMLKNARLVLVVGFGLSVLAGLGISALEECHADELKIWRRAALLAASAGCAFAFALIYLIHGVPVEEIIDFVRLPRFGVYLLLTSLCLVSLRLAGRLSPRSFASLAVFLIAADLATVSYGAIPFTRPRDVFPRIELFDRLPKKQTQPFRVAQLGYAYGANFELMYGYATVGGYELALENIKAFLKDLSRGEMDSLMFTTSGVLDSRDRRIDMLNAKYYIISTWDSRHTEFLQQPGRFRFLYTSGDTEVYENLKVLPRAFLVQAAEAEVIRDESKQLQRVKDPDFDPVHCVLLAAPPLQALPSPGSDGPVITTPRVEWRSQGMNSFEVDVNPLALSVLVVSQMYYPGWKAYVDGEPVPIARADYAFPAIFVGPGLHRVRFSFEPWTFKLGLALTILAVAVLLACACFRQRRQEGPGF